MIAVCGNCRWINEITQGSEKWTVCVASRMTVGKSISIDEDGKACPSWEHEKMHEKCVGCREFRAYMCENDRRDMRKGCRYWWPKKEGK